MNKLVLLFLLFFQVCSLSAQNRWTAKWVTDPDCQNESNSWYCFRKDFLVDQVPQKAIARIAIDSKYWLWINGKMVVFEGGLKRGFNPRDTYYDSVDIAGYLNPGANSISVLGWYFGKDGFSHVSSGRFGFLFECAAPGLEIFSNETWKVAKNRAYQTCPSPFPNFRLAESSIKYDATEDLGVWYASSYSVQGWRNAKVLGVPPMEPWNSLVPRPTPQWKDSKLASYTQAPTLPFKCSHDTLIVCSLPSNLQVTPYFKIEADADGKIIEMRTENFMGGGEPNVYAQYVSRRGIQEYESFGWMNGHKMIYRIPAGVKVLDLKYRETGFNTDFAGSFNSSDEFLNRIWQKAQRTLYLTMRDNYMDCPDRERAQWWGDEVNEGEEAFYALDTNSHLLFKKGMYELINWQRADSSLFCPIPARNWDSELPVQMLTSIGYYGFWNYYLNTGDLKTIEDLYGGVRKYLKIWKFNKNGTVKVRDGGWSWGDWGDNIDMDLLTNGFYYLALKGAANMAESLSLKDDVAEYRAMMDKISAAFNSEYWDGTAYRHPDYKGKTDDRCQALAVVSGIAGKDKYPALLDVFKREEHASPYMEKYVLEAIFQMGYVDFAIERMKHRFGDMVNNNNYATLFEGWNTGNVETWLHGTTNHAWSGGALTILSKYMCGIKPVEVGYKVFEIKPQPGSIKQASATIQSVRGVIKSSFDNSSNNFKMTVSVPKGSESIIGIPCGNVSLVKLNGKAIWSSGHEIRNKTVLKYCGVEDGYIQFKVTSGSYSFEAKR